MSKNKKKYLLFSFENFHIFSHKTADVFCINLLTHYLTRAEAVSPAEMNSMKQKVSIMEKELSSNALKLNTSENLKRTLEQKIAKYEKEQKDKENTQVSI